VGRRFVIENLLKNLRFWDKLRRIGAGEYGCQHLKAGYAAQLRGCSACLGLAVKVQESALPGYSPPRIY